MVATARAEALFRTACALDVAVRKPGNVSRASPGHGMDASHFLASAAAAAGPLCRSGRRVGDRIEAAVAASWAAAGCNTNLGIVLLCAPIARAAERIPGTADRDRLRAATEAVLADLDVADAAAAFRAIAHARPAGLGAAEAEDVREPPSVDLRTAMALAADRDSIARQYRDGFADVFWQVDALAATLGSPTAAAEPPPALTAAVQRVFLAFLAQAPDSHIVRKHGADVAHSVMRSAQDWQAAAAAGRVLDTDPGFAEWDAALKAAGVNPGTSADLTVAALFAAALVAG